MKFIFIINFILLAILFLGCQQEQAKPKADPTPEKKAEFKREVFDASKYPGLLAVGKLKIEKSWCAVTLLSEDIAVTAGHCFVAEEANLFKNLKRLQDLSTVEFYSKDGKLAERVKVQEIIKHKIDPDYAIIKLSKKIPKDEITPLKISDMTFTDVLGNTEKLGCAGFNGDKELGDGGKKLTISRNIKVFYEESNNQRYDTNCVSTRGGSGGLLFEEKIDEETKSGEYLFLGVIWGVTGDNYDLKGEIVNDKDVVTSITPVKAFRDELEKIIEEN